MKPISKSLFLLLLLSLFQVPQILQGQTWERQHPYPDALHFTHLTDVIMDQDGYGYAVGRNGSILKTDNFGTNWTDLDSGFKHNLASVAMIAGNSGQKVLIGGDEIILYSDDGGSSWTQLATDLQNGIVNEIAFFNATEFIAFVSTGEVIRLTNSGANVDFTVPNPNITIVRDACVLNQSAWYIDNKGRIMHSLNKGATWSQIDSFGLSGRVAISFVNEDLGFLNSSTGCYRTNNKGADWIKVDQSTTASSPSDLFALSPDILFLSTSNATIHASYDGGVNWNGVNGSSYSHHHSGICAIPGGKVWTTGYYKSIIHSTDSGQSYMDQLAAPKMGLNDIRFWDENLGYAVGQNNYLKTENGGDTWTSVDVGINNFVTDVLFSSANKVMLCGGYSHAIVSEDGGQNWSSRTHTDLGGFTDGFAQSPSGAISCYNSLGYMMRTADFGLNWTNSDYTANQRIYDANFPVANIGYAVGKGGYILKTVDDGLSWTRLDSITNKTLTRVQFFDALNGWIQGANFLASTSDGGLNWDIKSNSFYERGMHFKNKNEGWLITGSTLDGVILHTSDGGATWVPVDTIFNELKHMATVNSQKDLLWMAGPGGLIYHFKGTNSSVSGPSWVKEIEVFPNPSREIIQLNLPAAFNANSSIVLYSSGGQIISKHKDRTDIQVGHLPRGIYFLQFVHERQVFSTKVVLE